MTGRRRARVRPALRLKRLLLLFPIVLPLSVAWPAHADDTPAAPIGAASTPEPSLPRRSTRSSPRCATAFTSHTPTRARSRARCRPNRIATAAPALLLAIIAVESGFDRHAVSVAGARGLMQVMPTAHRDLVAHVKDLSDPATNVRIGAAIFRGYLDDADGDVETALVRYNGGTKRYALGRAARAAIRCAATPFERRGKRRAADGREPLSASLPRAVEPVAGARLRDDVRGPPRIAFQLAPQVADIHTQVVRILAVRRAPHLAQQAVVRQ